MRDNVYLLMNEPLFITNSCLRIGIEVVVSGIATNEVFSALEPLTGTDSGISEVEPSGEAPAATKQSAKTTN